MRPFTTTFLLLAIASLCLSSGCDTKSQTATVISKEFIPALKVPEDGAEPAPQERATPHDRWLVHVEMADRKKAQADVEQAQWNELRVGDKVTATYAQGNYTGTVWRVELRKLAPAATP